MARITVDDCLKRIPNRFDMTLVATIRARQLSVGGTPWLSPHETNLPSSRCASLLRGRLGWNSSLPVLYEALKTDIQKITHS